MDFFLNGQASGNVAATLMQHNFDPGALRPFIGDDRRSYITVNQGGKDQVVPVTNANATLRKNDWILLDEAVIRAARPRLKAFGALRSAGLEYVIPNGMSKTVMEYQTQNDPGAVEMSMDGLRRSTSDRPVWDLRGLPLPITHSDFEFSARQIMTSRQAGHTPIDTTMAEAAGRRVAEEVEKQVLGVSSQFSSFAYGGYTIEGYTNFTQRLTKAMTLPTAVGWTGATLVNEVLAMRQQSINNYYYGPWMAYNSPSWDIYLDADYSTVKGDYTVRDRLAKIEGIDRFKTLDYLTGYQILLVQKTSDVARAVVGMDFTTVQWETQGGLQLNFKVMCIMVPQLRYDFNSRTGIVHGTAS